VRTTLARSITVGLLVAGGALLSACSSGNNAASPTQSSAPATTSATSTVTTATTSSSSTGKATTTKSTGTGSKDVNCSANGAGKVGPKGGRQVDLIAVATQAGTVGCTEAFNVIDEYYRDAPTKSEGTAHVLTVQGWKCLADTGAEGSGTIGCDKNGLALRTR
jgi:hypothetical protein